MPSLEEHPTVRGFQERAGSLPLCRAYQARLRLASRSVP